MNVAKIKNLFNDNSQALKLLIASILLYVCFSAFLPTFGSAATFSGILSQIPEFGLYSMAMMMSMLIGAIDLSIVAVGNLCSILCAMFVKKLLEGSPEQEILAVGVGMLVALAVSAVCGVINGLLTTKIGIVPFLTTLGTMQLFDGVTMMITKGRAVSNLPKAYAELGMAKVGAIPVCFILFAVISLVLAFIVNKTIFGKKVILIGSNQNVARFSGINTDRIMIINCVIASMLAACAGLVLSSRVSSAKPGYGDIYQLQAILAVILGGVDSNGGYGKVFGVFASVLVLQVITTGVNAMRLGTQYFNELVWGIVLIAVLVAKYAIRIYREKAARRQ